MKNKFAGNCWGCGKRVMPGGGKLSKRNGRWAISDGCGASAAAAPGYLPDPEMELARREKARDNAEYARGMADADRYRDNVRYMGEEYAAAEELAWELKDPDPYY